MAQTKGVHANMKAVFPKFRNVESEMKWRKSMRVLAKILLCILIALLFLLAVFDPGFGRVLSCLGVIACCSMAAVFTDRYFRRRE